MLPGLARGFVSGGLPPLQAMLADAVGIWSASELLRTAHAGNLVLARRDDSGEQAIGSASGVLDAAALATFSSGVNSFTKTIYGQDAAARDVTQGTAANQPKIYDSATGLVTLGGAAAPLHDGSNDSLSRADTCGLSGATAITIAIVCSQTSAAVRFLLNMGTVLGDGREIQLLSVSATEFRFGIEGAYRAFTVSSLANGSPHNLVFQLAAGAPVSAAVMRQNGAVCSQLSVNNGSNTMNLATGATRIGARLDNTLPWNGKIPNVALWGRLLSAPELTTWDAHCTARYGT